jgi:hypothetical protein
MPFYTSHGNAYVMTKLKTFHHHSAAFLMTAVTYLKVVAFLRGTGVDNFI